MRVAETRSAAIEVGPETSPKGGACSIAILAGEASGDAYGGLLANRLHALSPDITLWGLGSVHMRAAGVEIIADCKGWAAIGVVQSLKVVPRLRFHVLPLLLSELRRRRPGLVIPIDFGAFNTVVCRWCKEHRIPVFYYLPPGSWRRRGPLPTRLAQVTDAIATQFPWSEERLRQAGARVTFVGHPLLDLIGHQPTASDFAESLGFAANDELIALLPGSRTGELQHISPAMAEAALMVHRRRPACRFVIALAESSSQDLVEEKMRLLLGYNDDNGRPIARIVKGKTHAVMANARAGLVCSGTATLEAAILGMPMVVLYRGSRLMYLEYLLRGISRIGWIALPNIIADRAIVPEFVARDATPGNLASALLNLLENPDHAATIKRDLAEVRASLGEPGATERAARLALGIMEASRCGSAQV